MKDTKSTKRSFLDVAIRVLYQFMLAAGTLFVVSAIYLIASGTTEAVLMFLPGIITFGGGLVMRQISRVSKLA